MSSISDHHASDRTAAGSSDTGRQPPYDQKTLEELLNLGDEAIAAELLSQLLSDFERLNGVIQVGVEPLDFDALARAAHELKGLSATIGARHLTQLAELVNVAANSNSAQQIAVFGGPLRVELERVIVHLTRRRDQAKGV
ncbi:Hpt domain-containing protein [Roseicitreum antarcticum]|uniref:Hpt domain-containing protein n=1 Tax=Roseicitreum antarcticum TaxID=564137 RepID=A0A1H2RCS2_9RHOB|nr:Hpt domain-containing protein [Roseicitreum antarcticum]SDW16644.1 Hpt domain-containing protein [Roseicitreum antarcticum]